MLRRLEVQMYVYVSILLRSRGDTLSSLSVLKSLSFLPIVQGGGLVMTKFCFYLDTPDQLKDVRL